MTASRPSKMPATKPPHSIALRGNFRGKVPVAVKTVLKTILLLGATRPQSFANSRCERRQGKEKCDEKPIAKDQSPASGDEIGLLSHGRPLQEDGLPGRRGL